jgi:hypothetical protein
VVVTKNEQTGEVNQRSQEQSAPVAQQFFQRFSGGTKLFEFQCGQRIELDREIFDATLASLLKEAGAFDGGTDVHASGVVGIAGGIDQAAALEPGNDAAHGGRLDLLGGRKFAERLRAGKDEDGERGQLRRTDARSRVPPANAAEKVDGSGMEAVSGGHRLGTRRHALGLDFPH